MKFLSQIQHTLEDRYGAVTGLDVLDFVRTAPLVPGLGSLLVEQLMGHDLDIALLLDRDILAAWNPSPAGPIHPEADPSMGPFGKRSVSVPFEEVSHFVYLAYNHNRGRNITALEMEMQSEVDRIFLAFHGDFKISNQCQKDLMNELLEVPYTQTENNPRYETARKAAADFVRRLSGGDPRAWSETEFERLRRFFHSDLGRKMGMSKGHEQ